MTINLTEMATHELEQLQRDAADLVQARRAEAESNRAILIAPAAVEDQVQALLDQVTALDAIIATPNAQIRDNPAPHVVALARANRRVINNLVRVLRVTSGVLDSADTGE